MTKWYKKQIDALKKERPIPLESEVKKTKKSLRPKVIGGTKTSRDPMAQRNRNRSKTDARPIFN